MAIRFTVNGIEFTVDTPAEAVGLQDAMSRSAGKKPQAAPIAHLYKKPAPPKSPSRAVASEPTKLLIALFTAPSPSTGPELAKSMGVVEASIPPMFAHARKWVEKESGLPFNLVVNTEYDATYKVNRFSLTPAGHKLIEEKMGQL